MNSADKLELAGMRREACKFHMAELLRIGATGEVGENDSGILGFYNGEPYAVFFQSVKREPDELAMFVCTRFRGKDHKFTKDGEPPPPASILKERLG